MPEIVECLAKSPIFSKLSECDRAELITLAQKHTYEKGEYICWQGEAWPMAGYLVYGLAEWTMLSPEGKRQGIFKINPCDVIWAHSILDGQTMPASLEAREPSLLLLWPGKIVMPIVSRNAEAVWDVSRVLLRYMRRVREVVYGFAFHPVSGRLARLLLDHYQPIVGQSAPRNLTLDQMAETVGTTRELVSRILHRFADDGLIRVNRVEFIFTDLNKLEDLARQE